MFHSVSTAQAWPSRVDDTYNEIQTGFALRWHVQSHAYRKACFRSVLCTGVDLFCDAVPQNSSKPYCGRVNVCVLVVDAVVCSNVKHR